MTPSRLIATTAGALAIASLVAPFGASAAQSGTTTATFTLTNGALGITTPAAPAALAADSTDAQVIYRGNLGATTVVDDRNSTSGWVAYAKSTAFTNGSGGSVPAGDVTIAIPAINVVGQVLAGENVTGLFVPDSDGTTGDADAEQWDHDGNGGTADVTAGGVIGSVATSDLTDALVDLTALLGIGELTSNNEVTYNPKVTVEVPAGTPSGTYSGVVTQTVL